MVPRRTRPYVYLMGWDVDGVAESRAITLLYSAAAEIVLAHFERDVADGHSVRSLYIRGREAVAYRKVFGDDFTSARDVVLSPDSPFAFFLVQVARDRSVPARGWDATEIARVDLRSGRVSTALDLSVYRERNDDGWIATLIDVSDDGTTMLCKTAAHREPRPPSGPRYGRIDYSLSRVTLANAEIEHLTALRNTYF